MVEITDEELQQVVAQTAAANNGWMQGDASRYDRLNSHSEDFTIMGPFGGPSSRGYTGWAERSPHIVRNFRNGACKLKVVERYASGDLLVLVLEEDQRGDVGDQVDVPWALRVTQVYRREGADWRVVHRHADPLMKQRSLPEIVTLARG